MYCTVLYCTVLYFVGGVNISAQSAPSEVSRPSKWRSSGMAPPLRALRLFTEYPGLSFPLTPRYCAIRTTNTTVVTVTVVTVTVPVTVTVAVIVTVTGTITVSSVSVTVTVHAVPHSDVVTVPPSSRAMPSEDMRRTAAAGPTPAPCEASRAGGGCGWGCACLQASTYWHECGCGWGWECKYGWGV